MGSPTFTLTAAGPAPAGNVRHLLRADVEMTGSRRVIDIRAFDFENAPLQCHRFQTLGSSSSSYRAPSPPGVIGSVSKHDQSLKRIHAYIGGGALARRRCAGRTAMASDIFAKIGDIK